MTGEIGTDEGEEEEEKKAKRSLVSQMFHQTVHFFSGFMGDPRGQLNSRANS